MKNNLKRLFLPAVALVSMCLTTGCDGALPGGGNSTRDKLTQKEITREQAKVVGNDIDAKQKDAYKGGSESKSAIRLAPLMAKDYTGDYSGWEYGTGYDDWDGWEYGDYQDNWSYQKQEGEDTWGYKEGEDYDAWFTDRAKDKKAEMPSKVNFSAFASMDNIDLKNKKQYQGIEEITLEFDLDNYFIREYAKIKGDKELFGTAVDGEAEMLMFYKDGYLYQMTIAGDKVDEHSVKMQLSESMISAYFSVLKQYAQEFFAQLGTGSSYLPYIDMFKEAGFECKYGSNDAGNLEMIIKGQDMTELGGVTGTGKSSVSLDASFVWDQYFMRSMELHLTGATKDFITESHAKMVFDEKCTPSYPSDSVLSTVKTGIIDSL